MAGLSRRLSKMPALPRDYLQISPLEKAITSKKAFLTPTPFCSGSNNPSGMRGTLMPSPFPEQLPPSGTAGACWLHEVETPSQEKKKDNQKATLQFANCPVCAPGSCQLQDKALAVPFYGVKFAAAAWFCIICGELPAPDTAARWGCPTARLMFWG